METESITNTGLLDLIGNTPLLDVSFLTPNSNLSLFAKAEWMNPGGSLKDRPVKRMLTKAIESGELTKDKIIIDSSSGNAGIAYSMIGNALGYKVQIVIPGNASESIWDIMARCALSEEEDIKLKAYTESKGMIYLCTPFSRAAAIRAS